MNIQNQQTKFQSVKTIQIPDIFNHRLKTGLIEFDEFLSGGFLPGSTFTLTARAGIGKSTLILQALNAATQQGYKTGIAGNEESIFQMAYTAKRLGVGDVDIANIDDLDEIIGHMAEYDILVIDSMQGLTTKHNFNTREHEKYCIETIVKTAKEKECVTGIICHLTKMGDIKGSSLVIHAVDTNIKIECPDLNTPTIRRMTMEKNRFGSVKEMLCEFTGSGYIFNTAEESEATPATAKPTSRKQLWEKVFALKPPVTLGDIMTVTNGNIASAHILAREMMLNNNLIKTGRGINAVYTATGILK